MNAYSSMNALLTRLKENEPDEPTVPLEEISIN